MTPDPTQAATNPYLYGWRYRTHTLPDGTVKVDQIPLTLEDVLHPEEGDVIPERNLHQLERDYLYDVFTSRLPGLHSGAVFSDLLIDWGMPDVRNHAPDISVFADLTTQPPPDVGIFDLKESGGRCALVIELVSPHTRENDVEKKFKEYHQVGVPFYILVDQEREDGPRELLAYEHTPTGYRRVPLTERGRVEIPPLGVCLGLGESRVVCYDTITGEEIGNYTQILEALEEAERKANELDEARASAEQQYLKESRARAEAERRASDEARARAEAERRADEAAAGRAEVERRASEEEQARKAAEDRLRDADLLLKQMQEELRRLRGENPQS